MRYTVRVPRRLLVLALLVCLLTAACTPPGENARQTADPVGREGAANGVGSGVGNLDGAIVAPAPDPTPLGISDDVRIGTLDNGLTYYVQSNDSPGSRLDLRLVVRAGSRQQEDPESGLAHFVEHMLFNGTESFDGNELDRVLQGFGVDFGADINAYTSYDETVYNLSVPTTDSAVDTALDVLFEWASKATLDEQDVIEERGVVREEFRIRDESSGGVIFDALNQYYVGDSPYAAYDPIGTPEKILATTATDARRYYDRWYRPDLMSIVAVGDLPTDELEALVRDRFDGLTSRSDGQPLDPVTIDPVQGVIVDLATHPEQGRPNISLDLPIPTWDSTTVGGERLLVIESVIDNMIRNRLDERIAQGSMAAILNSSGSFQIVPGRRFLGFNVTGPDLVAATEDLLVELRRLQTDGFTEAELARSVAGQQSALDNVASSITSRQDADYARSFVEHALGRGAIDDLSDTIDRQLSILASLDLATVDNHLAFMLAESDPILVGIGRSEDELPTRDELRAAIDRALESELVDESVVVAAIDQLMERPDRGDEPSERSIDELNATEMTFDNGVRVLFMESDIFAGNANLLALSEGGWSTLEAQERALVGLATTAVDSSGRADISDLQLRTFLASRSAQIASFIDETEEGFSGSAEIDDMETLFQLLYLSITAPRVDPAPLAEVVEQGFGLRDRAVSDPGLLATIARLDARFESPWFNIVADDAQLESLTADDLANLYRDRLGNTDELVIAIAGDTDLGQIRDLSRRYVATLPAGSADSFVDRRADPPSTAIALEVDAGTDDAGAGVELFFAAPVDISVGPEAQVVALRLEVLTNIVDARLFETVREELAATYGGRVGSSLRLTPDVEIETLITISGDPARLDEINAAVRQELTDLVQNGPTRDEFERARTIARSDHELVNNFTLMLWLHEAAETSSLGYFGTLEAIDEMRQSEVADLAPTVFPLDRVIEVTRS